MKVPTQREVSRMTNAELDATQEALEAWRDLIEATEDDEVDDAILKALGWIEGESDARDVWDHEDDRVRESVGNYRPATVQA